MYQHELMDGVGMQYLNRNRSVSLLSCVALAVLATIATLIVMETMVREEPVDLQKRPYWKLQSFIAEETKPLIVRSKYPDLVSLPAFVPYWTDAKLAMEWEGRGYYSRYRDCPVRGIRLIMCTDFHIQESIPSNYFGPAFATPAEELKVVYPRPAKEFGIEGSCDVYFYQDRKGFAQSVWSVCTNPIFKRSAEYAVRSSKFYPVLSGTGEVYRVEYKLP